MHNANPIILTPEQHIDEIMSGRPSYRERLQELDERILDVLYQDQLRQVGMAMWEPEPSVKRPGHKLAAVALNCLLWLPLIVLAFSVLRP